MCFDLADGHIGSMEYHIVNVSYHFVLMHAPNATLKYETKKNNLIRQHFDFFSAISFVSCEYLNKKGHFNPLVFPLSQKINAILYEKKK